MLQLHDWYVANMVALCYSWYIICSNPGMTPAILKWVPCTYNWEFCFYQIWKFCNGSFFFKSEYDILDACSAKIAVSGYLLKIIRWLCVLKSLLLQDFHFDKFSYLSYQEAASFCDSGQISVTIWTKQSFHMHLTNPAWISWHVLLWLKTCPLLRDTLWQCLGIFSFLSQVCLLYETFIWPVTVICYHDLSTGHRSTEFA